MPAYTVPGSQLFLMQMKSPLVLAVGAVTIGSAILSLILAKRLPPPTARRLGLGPWVTRYTKPIAVLVVALYAMIVIVATYATTRPGLDYGLFIDGANVTVRFYGDRIVSFNACRANYSVVSVDDALSMLKVRTNGLTDPTTGLYMGYYKTSDGSKAYVIVVKRLSDKALVFRLHTGDYVVVAVPGVEDAYKNLQQARKAYCKG